MVARETTMRRLNINLPEHVFSQLQELADKSGGSMTSVIRNGLSLAKLAYQEIERGNKLAVVSREGKVLREIVLAL